MSISRWGDYNAGMRLDVVRQLLALNRQFYDTFAGDFSDSRRTPQPGFGPAMAWLAGATRLVDVGCGDGRVAQIVPQSVGEYVGVDFSAGLLGQQRGARTGLVVRMVAADISQAGWAVRVGGRFDAAVCFSTLHHLPGRATRETALREMGQLLDVGARVVVSVWQPLGQARFAGKTVAWETVGLRESDVEAGDVLLSWERGGTGVRYAHHFEFEELAGLLGDCGYTVVGHYRSDGKTGDLGLYVQAVWGGGG